MIHIHKKIILNIIFLTIFFLISQAKNVSAVPAFYGAEGYGVNTTGGRGGKVMEVTNLNDSGTGSLRDCVNSSGARTCVFKVAGLITLSSPLTIINPNLTIAGQTAPGGGISLKKSSGGTGINIKTNNVIIRYITSRPGSGGTNNALLIASNGVEIANVIIDHSSFSWATDEVLTSWYRVINTTIQWNIVSEGLDCSTHPKGCHSKGLMLGGYAGNESHTTKGAEKITAHHNLIAHSAERGPILEVCGDFQIINNVTYNSRWTFAHQQDNCIIRNTPGIVNWIGNFHKKGPDSTSNSDLKMLPHDDGWFAGGSRIYVKDNIGPSRANNTLPEQNWVESGSRSFIVTTPANAPAVTTTDAQTAYNQVVAEAGNSKGVGCDGSWFSRRDSIDTRVVNDVKNGTGRIIDDPSQVGGWITPASGTGCTDSDRDGMSDSWETAKFGNLTRGSATASTSDFDADGYTDLEEYLNGTDPKGGGVNPTTPVASPTNPVNNSPTPTPGPNSAAVRFNLRLPDVSSSLTNIPASETQIELRDGATSLGNAAVTLVKYGNYFQTNPAVSFNITQNRSYTVAVKTRTSIRRQFSGVNLTRGQTLDCTVASNSNCGELISQRDNKLLFFGDSDGYSSGSGSFNKIDSADIYILGSYFNNPLTSSSAVANFNLDSLINISDLEILGRNYGKSGE